jgi:hypothetical protein
VDQPNRNNNNNNQQMNNGNNRPQQQYPNQQQYNNNGNNRQWSNNNNNQQNRPQGLNTTPFMNRQSFPPCQYCGKTNHREIHCYKRPDRVVHRITPTKATGDTETSTEGPNPSTSTAPQQTIQNKPTVATTKQQTDDVRHEQATNEETAATKQENHDNNGWQVWTLTDTRMSSVTYEDDDQPQEAELYVGANEISGTTTEIIMDQEKKVTGPIMTKRPSRLYIDVMINKVIIRGLLDTGAQITLMRRSMYRKHFLRNYPISKEGKNCYGFDGVQSSPIDGTFECDVEIGGKKFPLKVHVVPTLDVDAIFSNHMIHDFKMDIYASTHKIKICNKQIPVYIHAREAGPSIPASVNVINMEVDPTEEEQKKTDRKDEPDSTTEMSMSSELDPDRTLSDNDLTITPEPRKEQEVSIKPATVNRPNASIFGIPNDSLNKRLQGRKSFKRKLPHKLYQSDHNEDSLIKRLCNWKLDGPCTSHTHDDEPTTTPKPETSKTIETTNNDDPPELIDTPVMTVQEQQTYDAYMNIFDEKAKSINIGVTSTGRRFRLPEDILSNNAASGDSEGLATDRWNIPEEIGNKRLVNSKVGYKKMGNSDELMVTRKTSKDTRYCIQMKPGEWNVPDEYGITFNTTAYRCTYGNSSGIPTFHRDYDTPRECPRHWTKGQFNNNTGQGTSTE